jgi:hypothetical protein
LPDLRIKTDMGDWETIPRRLRVAFVMLVAVALLIGVGVALGVLTLAAGVLALSGSAIALLLVFDRRRS